jgi:MerR family transcriptional regulator, heat shock protein HspR
MKRKKKYFLISAVSEKFGVHPQTLRIYEREGLLTPVRSEGNTRMYDEESLKRLHLILTLTRELGVNLAGVEVILNMREKMIRIQQDFVHVMDLVRREILEKKGRPSVPGALIPAPPSSLAKKSP